MRSSLLDNNKIINIGKQGDYILTNDKLRQNNLMTPQNISVFQNKHYETLVTEGRDESRNENYE
jgi:hypothetical protein